MVENSLKSVVEAFLFASEKPLTIEQIKKALDNMNGSEIKSALEELKNDYQEANRGIRIIEIAEGYQMATPETFAPFLKKLFNKGRHTERLSKAALETLAIIAYRQPVTKMEIESLRSVNVDGVISSLMDKMLVRIAGRKKAPGRPHVFGTTRQFLEHFGLRSLKDLPDFDKFSSFAEENQKEFESDDPVQENTEETNDSQKIAH